EEEGFSMPLPRMGRKADVRRPVVHALVVAGILTTLVGCAAESGSAHAQKPERTTSKPVVRSDGNILPATDAASFQTALDTAQPGDTIELADGGYDRLFVSGKTFPVP